MIPFTSIRYFGADMSKRKYTNRIAIGNLITMTVPSRNREVTPGDFNERTRECSSTLPRTRCDSSRECDLQFQLVPSPRLRPLFLFAEGQANRRRGFGDCLNGILKNLTATDLAYILHSPMKFCGSMVIHHRL